MSEPDDQLTEESRSLFNKFKVFSRKAEWIRELNRCTQETRQERNQSMDTYMGLSPLMIHIPAPPPICNKYSNDPNLGILYIERVVCGLIHT